MRQLESAKVRNQKLSITYLCQLLEVSRKGYYKHTFTEQDEDVKVASVLHYCQYVRSKLHNAMAERLNGIIKNDWLYNFEDKPIDQVREILSQTIALYNTARPHRALNKKTPMQMLIPDYPNPLTTQHSKNQTSKNNSPKAPSLKTLSPCRSTPDKDLSLCTSAVKTTTSRVPQQEQN